MISLYIHIPFCRKKCFYCSFVVAIGQDRRIDEYLDCLSLEAERYRGALVRTVHLGGGTPTHLNSAQLKKLFMMLKKKFRFTTNCEMTVEANPESLDFDKAELLNEFGVNRISLGIQTLNDRYLKYLGRCHDSRRASTAFSDLRRAGFQNINVDLMYSFPGQTDEEIKTDVVSLTDLGSEHLSLYTLTIEENSRFYTKNVKLAATQTQARQYELVAHLLEQTSFQQYEISNFARPRRESSHNLNYWQGGNYVGLGVSAHSHHNGVRCWNVARVSDYMSRIKDHQNPAEGEEKLSARQRFMEILLFGLRMNQGVKIPEIKQKWADQFSPEVEEKIHALTAGGFLRRENDYLKATAKGRLVLDEISAQLI